MNSNKNPMVNPNDEENNTSFDMPNKPFDKN